MSAPASRGRAARPLRVAFLVDRWEPGRGGAERALAGLARHLEERGHEVLAIAATGAPGAPGRLVRVAARGLSRARREAELARALVDEARALESDVTVGMRHLPRVDLYWPHAGAHRRALEARRRARGRDPSAEPRGRHRVFLALEQELLSRGGARLVACPSRLVLEELGQLHPAARERLVLVPNGVDLEAFAPGARAEESRALRRELGVGEREPLVAFVARNPLLKGLPRLLDALALLDESAPWKLVVGGPRRPEPWRRLAARAGLGERVVVRSEIDPRVLLPAADVLAHPTWRDACSLVVLEALACGTPVVTTAYEGAAEAVGEAQGEIVRDPAAAAALAAALSRVLARAARGGFDREAVRAAVAQRGREAWLARLEELVLGLAGAGGAPAGPP